MEIESIDSSWIICFKKPIYRNWVKKTYFGLFVYKSLFIEIGEKKTYSILADSTVYITVIMLLLSLSLLLLLSMLLSLSLSLSLSLLLLLLLLLLPGLLSSLTAL